MLAPETVNLSNHRLKKSKEALKQANVLLENQMFDGSINRSYYAIFYSIRSILALIGLDSKKHSGVLSIFDRYFVKMGIFEKKFSRMAHTAFDVRQDCDYEDFFVPSEDDAKTQYSKAEIFVAEIEQKRQKIINKQIILPEV